MKSRTRNNDSLHLRLPRNDKKLLETLAAQLGISTAGTVRMAIKRMAHQRQAMLHPHG